MKRKRIFMGFMALLFLMLALVVMNICIGSVRIPLSGIFEAFFSGGESAYYHIIWDIRFPRLIAAIFLGGALSVSGLLLQVFFHNPIAGPYVLGISSAAKLVVAIVLILSLKHGVRTNSFVMILAAFMGSMLAMGFILIAALKVRSISVLIVCGVMIGYICSAVTDIAVTFADDSNIVNLHSWSLGSFSGISRENDLTAALIVTASTALAILLSKAMGAYLLGEVYAANLGVNIKRFRICLILLSGLLSSCVTAFAGPISFVGIAVPHLVRNTLRTEKPSIMIPGCFLGGAVFCLLSDLIARSLFAPVELSISTVTSVFGAPVMLWLLLDPKRRSKG